MPFPPQLLHEFGWTVRLAGSIAEWLRPDGTRFDPGPDPPQRGPAATGSLSPQVESLPVAV